MFADWKEKGDFFRYKQAHNIFFRREGNGSALLLLHGFPTASWDWNKIWPALCDRFEVIAPDFIGFGFSDKPASYSYSILDQADLIEAIIQAQGFSEVHILAHDYGDTVAQELLARYIERRESKKSPFEILSVCFLNGGLFPESHQPRAIQKLLVSPFGSLLTPFLNKNMLRRNFSKIFGPDTQATSKEIDEFYALIEYNNGQPVFHKLIRYMKERKQYRDRWVGALLESPIPMRLIDGALDPVSGRHLAERYIELVPESDVIILDAIGHYPQTEAPEKTLLHFFEFIEKNT